MTASAPAATADPAREPNAHNGTAAGKTATTNVPTGAPLTGADTHSDGLDDNLEATMPTEPDPAAMPDDHHALGLDAGADMH